MSIYKGTQLISGVQTVVDKSERIGQIIQSTIPLTDAGLHLLDGALIDGNGIYSAFVDYIASIYDASASYFTTEANWQQSVTTYGVCGKFVYDDVNNTVRLPKITGFTESTITPTELGDLVEAGLPNIIGGDIAVNKTVVTRSNGALYTKSQDSSATTGFQVANGLVGSLSFDASRSSSIYGNSTTVQPQSIKVLYYIVIATSTKTDIEVDIDEIATDLNGKADVDLTNINASCKALDGQWVVDQMNVFGDTSLTTTVQTFDLSNYLPNDNYYYEVSLSINLKTTSGIGANFYGIDADRSKAIIAGLRSVTTGNTSIVGLTTIIGANRELYTCTTSGTVTAACSVQGYRRIGTNQ